MCSVLLLSGQSIYRTLITPGNWNTPSHWQIRTGANAWAISSTIPSLNDSVFIQRGHTMSVTLTDASCYNLNIDTFGILTIGGFNVNVYGKIRGYVTASPEVSSADGAYVGVSSPTLRSSMIGTASTGVLKFVGGTRNITVSGEWNSNGTNHNTEFALNAGAVGTLNTGFKSKKIKISSGNIVASNLMAVSASAGDSSFVIKNGAKFTTGGGTSTNYLIASSSKARCNLFVIDLGGTLEFTGVTPNISVGSFVNNGTILYTSTVNQNLVQNILQNSDGTTPSTTAQLNSYSNIQISGAVAHTVTAQSSISIAGSLQVDAGVTLDMNLLFSTYDITGTLASVTNNGTIVTYSTSTTPIPAGKDWQGVGTGKVIYGMTSGTTGQTVVTGQYKNLEIKNTSSTTGRTKLPNGTISISGVFTFVPTSSNEIDVNDTINFNNPTGGQTIPATIYSNLTISSNATVNQSLASGTIFVQGYFNPGSYPNMFYVPPSHTFNFNK